MTGPHNSDLLGERNLWTTDLAALPGLKPFGYGEEEDDEPGLGIVLQSYGPSNCKQSK